ncbi:zinc-dependent alcohol dehydrogenase family protein [Rhodococcus sp. KBS0724]|uniref:zinc-dependent alcohol dehydrogenase family protein n=1 Tax=Rhodococcus sp. KBS0724 TaxID=1179674 RepID=UPI00110D3652|nr:zinc-dependent alcohol dehydrogenase family protein [Rhodococcus sp. KBS0724]TSD47847.1 zinc-dependent alcohol dehydrogenase family protein [Rhodococcus sp. KBS0724]
MSRVVVFNEFGGPEVLQIVEEPVAVPAAGELRIKIEAIGINRLDQMMRSGSYPGPVHLPRSRLGCEGTGLVDAVGSAVEGFSVGDAVIVTAVPDMDVNGTYAEYVLMPANAVIARPEGLDATSAAALWVAYSTAYGALVEKAKMQPGDHVVITAASSAVGLAAIQIANLIGAIPIAITRHAAKKDILLAAGAAVAVATDRDDVVDVVREYTHGAGADIILDSVMGPGLVDLAKVAKFGGTLVAVGWLDPRPAEFPMNWPLTIFGYMSFEHVLDSEVVHRIATFLSAGIRTGALKPTVDKVFRLDDIVDAHHYLDQGQQVGKIVVTL